MLRMPALVELLCNDDCWVEGAFYGCSCAAFASSDVHFQTEFRARQQVLVYFRDKNEQINPHRRTQPRLSKACVAASWFYAEGRQPAAFAADSWKCSKQLCSICSFLCSICSFLAAFLQLSQLSFRSSCSFSQMSKCFGLSLYMHQLSSGPTPT